MPTTKGRWLLGAVAGAVSLTLAGTVALAAGPGAPWFQLGAPVPQADSAPLQLLAGYQPFWIYADGLAWADYNQERLARSGTPAIYLARSATPLPTLPSQPEAAGVVAEDRAYFEAPALKQAPESAPAPAPKPEPPPAPKPEPEPAPAPAPKPEPAPAPAPKPAPAPTPTPVPAPDPDPVPDPEPWPAPEPAPEPWPEPSEPQPAPVPAPKPTPAPSPTPAPAPASGQAAAEQQMLALVNAERAAAGLPPLTADSRLTATARAKSQDMITGNYFDHNSPTLGSPFEQMRAAGITYRAAAENLAGNQTVEAAHQALMNSPGHRANILSSKYNKIGIGIIAGGRYGLMVTQQFIGD
ncbi:MAG TPA: CAP domain-containing protein [Symbiobacteriaceae bacterium]|nr:CAP domain-containing protein [Symbiobacteriaceae bacterium]